MTRGQNLEVKDERIKTLECQVEQLKARQNADEQSLPLGEMCWKEELDRRHSVEKRTYSSSVDKKRGSAKV